MSPGRLRIEPVTRNRWDDLESLFGRRGACGGCWCMWWRLAHKEYEAQKGAGNRRAFKQLVTRGSVPGLLAYDGDQPVAWCSLAPREDFVRLARSRILKPVDEQQVWSIVCFFVSRPYRNRGVSGELLDAAIAWMRSRGGRILEGYPVEPKTGRVAPLFAYTGLADTFRRAGFVECARRSPTRPIMRYIVDESPAQAHDRPGRKS